MSILVARYVLGFFLFASAAVVLGISAWIQNGVSDASCPSYSPKIPFQHAAS
jgi:hypothetical protein